MAEIDAANTQFVGKFANGIVVSAPAPMRTRQAVYRHTAWLLEMSVMLPDDTSQVDAAGDPYTLEAYREAVRNT